MEFSQERYPVNDRTCIGPPEKEAPIDDLLRLGFTKSTGHVIKIQVIHGKTGNFQEKILTPEIAVRDGALIGRNSKCDIVLSGPEVSRIHGKIVYTAEQYCFTDLGSTSGSQVNNRKVQPWQQAPLKSDDIIRIGKFVLLVEEFRRSRDLLQGRQADPAPKVPSPTNPSLQNQRLIFKAEELKEYGVLNQETSEFVFQGKSLVGIFSLSKRLQQKALNLWQSELDAGRFCILVEYSNHFAIWGEKRVEK